MGGRHAAFFRANGSARARPGLKRREIARQAMSLAGMFVGSNVEGSKSAAELRFIPPSGSAGRIRTYDQPINSRLLYH